MSLVAIALEYEKLGWFVLPIHPVEKRPLVKWARRKNQKPNSDEIIKWFKQWPYSRMGIATGTLSGIDVVDIDGPQARERFETLFGIPETVMQSTGRKDGGLHLLFKHNGNVLRNIAGKSENKGIDLRKDASCCADDCEQYCGECSNKNIQFKSVPTFGLDADVRRYIAKFNYDDKGNPKGLVFEVEIKEKPVFKYKV